MKSKGFILFLAILAGIALGVVGFVSHIRANSVSTVTCGIVDVKPSVFFKSCADGGTTVGEIKWSSWSKDGARGSGTYAINDCKPDCKSGTLTKVPVTVVLSGSNPLKEVRGKRLLDHITIATVDKNPLPLGTSNTDSWVLE